MFFSSTDTFVTLLNRASFDSIGLILNELKKHYQLPFTVSDTTFRKIIGGQFHTNFIARYNTNEVLTHTASNMCQNLRAVLQLYAKTSVRKGRVRGLAP